MKSKFRINDVVYWRSYYNNWEWNPVYGVVTAEINDSVNGNGVYIKTELGNVIFKPNSHIEKETNEQIGNYIRDKLMKEN